MKRAFKSSLLLHAAIYFVLFIFSSYLYLGASNAELTLCPGGILAEASFAEKLASNGNRRLLHGMHENDHEHGEHHHGPPPRPVPWAELPEGETLAALLAFLLEGQHTFLTQKLCCVLQRQHTCLAK